jgi:Zn-dependent protease with chaperone function
MAELITLEPTMRSAASRLEKEPMSLARLIVFFCMAGYYPFLIFVCLGAGWLAVTLFMTGIHMPRPFKGVLIVLALPFAIMVVDVVLALPALFLRVRGDDEFEIDVPRQWMKGLHALVEQVADERGVAPPDEIRLHAASVAHVYEDHKGRRILVVGGVAVAAFSQDALAGVIAHELGHFAGGDTGLARIALRWHLVMGNLEARLAAWNISRVNPLAWMIRGYHFLFNVAWAANKRSQEFAADRHEVELVGKEVAASSTVLFTITELMPWVRLSAIAESCVAARESMQAIFAEQARRARAARPSEWQDACRKALKQKTGLFDTHPCLRERLQAMGVSPRAALRLAVPSAEPPARALFANWDLVEKLLTEKIMAIFREVYQQKMELAQVFTRRGPSM